MWNFFDKREFECKCGCGKNNMSSEVIDKLDEARAIAAVPFILNSAYRCLKHNRSIGSADTSSHVKGLAVDIRATDSRSRFVILCGLIDAGFTRIGIRKDFIHADDDRDKDSEVLWLY